MPDIAHIIYCPFNAVACFGLGLYAVFVLTWR